ncbi:uncharacterized protein AMSG_04924 [Thecamonas trahens ATCC 50062]|uniref:Uncharacterized protein n=1 Tax=Thecamonas trahens ATCC 50062 TaxID=461836 RepID=A0A0L0D8R7_THETB|nr:hypothetical protein AMSG_04924 [Thecamonas trahens ATCC 50062]KNC48476.1 hypothetical protein AMSG_04924 [Thecamonas trahens ATCC 50062]|eukprot:XP_013758588.1 hypothetical protein AMSG_04924 [Thecamonas trahens ATCC 50062]
MSSKKKDEGKKEAVAANPDEFDSEELLAAELRERNRKAEEARKRDMLKRKEAAGRAKQDFSCAVCWGCSDPNAKLEEERRRERRRRRRAAARASGKPIHARVMASYDDSSDEYSYTLSESSELQELDCCTAVAENLRGPGASQGCSQARAPPPPCYSDL